MAHFEQSFSSLYQAGCPEWFRDAKFGIWSHWGPQSVPMYGDWYARNMYIQDTDQYKYHVRHYGHPSKFGYKDICALWKAERFDPNALMALYVKAGAKYFVAQAMHHDHFFNYASKLNRMNSVEVGPHKDICGLWQQAAARYHLPFGLTEHLSASFSWWRVNKGCDSHGPYAGVPYDGNDPAWRDFYFDNGALGTENPRLAEPWYTDNAQFHAYWVRVMKELIDLYTPDMLYTDGSLPFGEHWIRPYSCEFDAKRYEAGLEVAAYLYNASIAKYGKNQAIYTQKDKDPQVYRVGILDVERSQLPDIAAEPWQTDTCIGGWFYDVRTTYKTAQHVAEMLVDIIAKNGTLLLNIPQRPDGTIDDEARYLLEQLGAWFSVCAEGVYHTRPWKRAVEGSSRVLIDGFREERTAWNETDIRFTCKDHTVYAFLMGTPRDHAAVLRSFHEGEHVRNVRLLGAGNVAFSHAFGVLTVQLPDRLPADFVNCLAVELD